MARYIDVENFSALFDEEFKKTKKLIEQGETHLDNLAEGFLEADRVIRKIPAADVVEVKHGQWQTEDTILGKCCVCSVCGSCPTMEYKYCPYCGAKMDWGK